MRLLLILFVGVTLLLLCVKEQRTYALDSVCVDDIIVNRKIDIVDIASFNAPVNRNNTSPIGSGGSNESANYDVRWDVQLGPQAPFTAWINITDLTHVIVAKNTQGWCDTPVRFASYVNDMDAQWTANPTATAAMMNANYEAILTFDCGICRAEGNAFNGITYVYQDPLKICGPSDPFCTPECEGEQPGTDCSDILPGTGTCWQKGFPNERYLADVTQGDVRDEIVAKALTLEADSAFDGIYLDVAEAYLPNAVEGCTPAVTNAQWLSGWAILADRLDKEVPGLLVLNAQWTFWDETRAVSELDAGKFFRAADAVEQEFGWAYGLHGEGTASGAAEKLAYIDYVHAQSTAVWQQEYPGSTNDIPSSLETFGLAMYLIGRDSGDYYSTYSSDGHGTAFDWAQDYGEPTGPRTSCGSGCYSRQYEGGLITANVVSKTATLP